jgi:hypothetical protein
LFLISSGPLVIGMDKHITSTFHFLTFFSLFDDNLMYFCIVYKQKNNVFCRKSTESNATTERKWTPSTYWNVLIWSHSNSGTQLNAFGDVFDKLVVFTMLMHLRNRLQTASYTACHIPGLRSISGRAHCNRLHEHDIRPQRLVICPYMPTLRWTCIL